MSDAEASRQDDWITVIAVSVLACVLQDVLHEGLGHAVTAWLSGARQLTLSTVALDSDIDTRWISANGTLVNLLFALIFWLLLRKPERYKLTTRYFLVLAMAGNLFTGTGYFFFSGVTNFGDWAAVIRGLQPHWMWQLGLILAGMASYYASVLLVAAQLKPFQEKKPFVTTPSRSLLDAVLYRRDSRRLSRPIKSRRVVLRSRLGAALYFGRKRWALEPAKHDAQGE